MQAWLWSQLSVAQSLVEQWKQQWYGVRNWSSKNIQLEWDQPNVSKNWTNIKGLLATSLLWRLCSSTNKYHFDMSRICRASYLSEKVFLLCNPTHRRKGPLFIDNMGRIEKLRSSVKSIVASVMINHNWSFTGQPHVTVKKCNFIWLGSYSWEIHLK